MAKTKSKPTEIEEENPYEATNWATKYRPNVLSDVYGQKEAVDQLKSMIKNRSVPSAILFTGSTGTGKTTLTRVLARTINGEDSLGRINDYSEVNFGAAGGVDDVRAYIESMNWAPQAGAFKIKVLDEFHAGGSRKSYDALLKPLEDPPKSSLWLFATDQPEKLPKTILGRCQIIALNKPEYKETGKLLLKILKAEGKRKLFSEKKDVIRISKLCDGQPRASIQALQAVVRVMDSGGTYKSGLKSCLSAIDGGEGLEASIKLLAALYSENSKTIIKCIPSVKNFHSAIPRMLELNKYHLETLSGNWTYKSADRMKMLSLMSKVTPDLSTAIIVHQRLVDLRERMSQYAVQEYHLAVAILLDS